MKADNTRLDGLLLNNELKRNEGIKREREREREGGKRKVAAVAISASGGKKSMWPLMETDTGMKVSNTLSRRFAAGWSKAGVNAGALFREVRTLR